MSNNVSLVNGHIDEEDEIQKIYDKLSEEDKAHLEKLRGEFFKSIGLSPDFFKK